MNDKDFMKQALDLAEKGAGFTSPNPLVGAVVVKSGRIIGRGWHAACGSPHAEVVALDDAGAEANGAVLYVTLEPCNHTGRTPPCTETIIAAGIRRVIVARRDPNPDVAGGGIEYLKQQGIEITEGVCEAAARRQLEWFEKYSKTKVPFVTLKCALTLDGRIATRTGDSRWVTGPEARAQVHRLRQAADAIMVGSGTVKADNPRLTTRLEGQETKDPVRVILDTRLSIDESAAVFNPASDAETIIVAGEGCSSEKREQVERQGARVLEIEMDGNGIKLEALINRLGEMGLASLLIEGGSRVSGSALAAGIVDKICFFYAPKILGGDDGVPVCSGAGPALMKDARPIQDMTVVWIGDDVLIEGYLS